MFEKSVASIVLVVVLVLVLGFSRDFEDEDDDEKEDERAPANFKTTLEGILPFNSLAGGRQGH